MVDSGNCDALFFGYQGDALDSGYGVPPDPMTEACSEYFRHTKRVMQFLLYEADVNVLMAKIRHYKHDIFVQFKDDKVEEAFSRSFLPAFDASQEILLEHYDMLSQMTFCAITNSYLSYVSDLLSLIFRTKPQALKSRQMMEIQEILSFESLEKLVSAIADRRVNRLAYKSMGDLNRELTTSLGLPLFHKSEELERAKAIIEVRNLVTHGRAVTNSLFVSRLRREDLKVGERLQFDPGICVSVLRFLSRAASRLDKEAAGKFGLPLPITRQASGL